MSETGMPRITLARLRQAQNNGLMGFVPYVDQLWIGPGRTFFALTDPSIPVPTVADLLADKSSWTSTAYLIDEGEVGA